MAYEVKDKGFSKSAFGHKKSFLRPLILEHRYKFIIVVMVCWGGGEVYAVLTVFQLFNGDRSQIHVSWTVFLPVLRQSIILTLAGQSLSYSHNPERHGGKPLLPVFNDRSLSWHIRGNFLKAIEMMLRVISLSCICCLTVHI